MVTSFPACLNKKPLSLFAVDCRGNCLKQGILVQGFGVADEQIGPWVHGIVKAPDKGISGGLIKIDHDIAAENDIEFETEADRLHQIEGTEYHVVPDGLGDTVEPPCPLPAGNIA